MWVNSNSHCRSLSLTRSEEKKLNQVVGEQVSCSAGNQCIFELVQTAENWLSEHQPEQHATTTKDDVSANPVSDCFQREFMYEEVEIVGLM